MAKIRSVHTAIQGKLGDLVYIQSGRYGPHVRKAVAPGRRRDDPAIKLQFSRTKYLNGLAGGINTVVNKLAGTLKARNFYEQVQQRFRREPDNNRLLLLRRLVGMEANTRYAFLHHVRPELQIGITDTELKVHLAAKEHPVYRGVDADSYAYEVSLVTWDLTDDPPRYEQQFGEWIELKGGPTEFDFIFSRPASAVHWMLCLRLCPGRNGYPHRLFTGDGMLIYNIGSFDAAEQAWLNGLPSLRALEKQKSFEEEEAPVQRVKAKTPPLDE